MVLVTLSGRPAVAPLPQSVDAAMIWANAK